MLFIINMFITRTFKIEVTSIFMKQNLILVSLLPSHCICYFMLLFLYRLSVAILYINREIYSNIRKPPYSFAKKKHEVTYRTDLLWILFSGPKHIFCKTFIPNHKKIPKGSVPFHYLNYL